MKIEQEGEILTALLPGEIDHHSAVSIREEIDQKMLELVPALVRLDFTNVGFMDSSGMGLVLGRYKKAKQIGIELEVVGTSGRVKNMLSISGLTKLVSIK